MSKFMTEVDSLDAASVTHHHDGGYDLKIFDEIEVSILEKYKCAVCKKVLKNAIQFISESNVPSRACDTCYMDTANTSNEGCGEAYPDKIADKEINELKVFCSNKGNGCTWGERLKFRQRHESECMYRSHKCHYCKQWVISNGHEDNCQEMPQACRLCYKLVIRKNFEDHQKFCQMQFEQCICGERFALSEEPSKILYHLKHQKKCLYSYIGCETDGIHEDERHDALVVSKFVELKRDFIAANQKNEEKDIKIQQFEIKCVEMLTEVSDFREQMNGLRESVEYLQKEITKLKDQLSQPQFPILGGGARLKKDINVLNFKVTDMENKNSEVNQVVADVENKTLNGELIWKIDNLDFRMAQAKLGRVTELHSNPCYTKQYGYKYCIRLCLHGDGIGRTTHISIFFILMKSEYDELLPWPMQKRVTVELVNLRNETDSVIETFVSNPKSDGFQRPTKNMNVACAWPTFISIEQFLNGCFIKDNSTFIRATVKDEWRRVST